MTARSEAVPDLHLQPGTASDADVASQDERPPETPRTPSAFRGDGALAQLEDLGPSEMAVPALKASPEGRVLQPDLDETRRFLEVLDPKGIFTFQIFAGMNLDGNYRSGMRLHGTFDEHAKVLSASNQQGADVFVMVNEWDSAEHGDKVIRVRAHFLNFGGASLRPVLDFSMLPHIVVEGSPGRYHLYWLVNDCSKDDFDGVQRTLDGVFRGAMGTSDFPYSMRLPGFYNCKGKKPFISRLHDGHEERNKIPLQDRDRFRSFEESASG